jgi:transposase InsO family protein
VADTSISGIRVARELDRLFGERGKPGTIVSDNGTELTSEATLQWADDHRGAWRDIAPGKPQQNAFIGRMRDEMLNESPLPLAPSRADDTHLIRRGPTVRCAALRRPLRTADRRHHRPAGQQPANRKWMEIGARS